MGGVSTFRHAAISMAFVSGAAAASGAPAAAQTTLAPDYLRFAKQTGTMRAFMGCAQKRAHA